MALEKVLMIVLAKSVLVNISLFIGNAIVCTVNHYREVGLWYGILTVSYNLQLFLAVNVFS